ncbi:MAG: ribonuclease H-like domain-containing protein [Candidatus Woesearchaeota archaeon]
MLMKTLAFLPGISQKMEERLQAEGLTDWTRFSRREKIKGISSSKKILLNHTLDKARVALLNEDSKWFAEHLPPREHWQLYDEFKDDVLFIDIEIASKRNHVTVIGISDGLTVKTLMSGMHIDKNTFQRQISRAKLLVSFNGKSFDIPVLEKFFGIKIETPHFDARHACARVGLKGGLKQIEKELGIYRPIELRGNPVDLWKAFMASGDREWLEKLAEYNAYDCLNLKLVCEKIVPILSGAVSSPWQDSSIPSEENQSSP